MRRIIAVLASLALILTLVPALALAAPSTNGTWIVTLRGNADPDATAHTLLRTHGGELRYVYESAIRGFAFRGSPTAASAIARNPNVALVEADADVWLETTQTSATWGLDRIDQKTLPLSTTYSYEATGTGVTAYVIDSGILTTHSEFGGRASLGHDLVGTNGGQDCNGHGTHVAGTIGGVSYGVAKAVSLVAVRVFDCTGGSSWSTIIAGIDWVIDNHASGPAVANLSIGGGASSSVDTAVRNLIADGVATAVAAGNGDWLGRQANACNSSPARVAEAMTVSATDRNDTKASWANYGDCVDWFAPGVSVVSAGISGDGSIATKSGTSMATPHTAGAAALYLDLNESATPQQVRDALFANTTKDIVSSSSTANNDLLYTGFIGTGGGGGGGGGGTAPTAAFTANLTSGVAPLSVTFSDESTGTPTSWNWDFGDGGASDLQSPSHTYSSAGEYTVSLTATNSAGEDIETKVAYITVMNASGGGITLAANGYKVKGVQKADLTWSGATSGSIEVWRDEALIATTTGSAYTDNINKKGGGSYIYKVCEAGTTVCSNEVAVSY